MLRALRQRLLCPHRAVLTGFGQYERGAARMAWKRCLACGRVGWNYVMDARHELPWLHYF